MKFFRPSFSYPLSAAALAASLVLPAHAVDIDGVHLDDATKVANTDLKLNGAGIRTKIIFKVYAAGLYLTEKKSTVQEVLDAKGPRRVELVMLRDISSADFTEAFLHGLSANADNSEKARLAGPTVKFGSLFTDTGILKKGDVVRVDWLPGSGTLVQLNGKSLSEPLPDLAFYNALLKIWLGDNPADARLKTQLLGAKG